jgi:protein transport protein SEC31
MVKLKEVPRAASFAWSPNVEDPLLVTGTVSGAIDADFSSKAQLEFWNLNLDNTTVGQSAQLEPVKSLDTDAKFYDIAWGGISSSKPKGVVAGALESGILNLWDPEKVMSGAST